MYIHKDVTKRARKSDAGYAICYDPILAWLGEKRVVHKSIDGVGLR
jgi:hypothetical protein